MNGHMRITMGLAIGLASTSAALAGDATTDAWADSGRPGQNGSAGATADWNGNGGRGFARTDTRSGRINLARGIAVGFDRDGIDLSFSHAIAPNRGPGYAGTLNVSIGRDGAVNHSYGGTVAMGGHRRDVRAGGATRSGGRDVGAAVARASGNTRGGGIVRAGTHSHQYRPRPAVVRRAPDRGRPVRRLIGRSVRLFRR